MKKIFFLSLFLTTILLSFLTGLTFIAVKGQPFNVTFTINLTVTGNANPTVTWVQTGVSANPVESSTRTVYFAINVTDNNGFADVNYTSATITLDRAGEERVGTCTAYNNDTLVMQLNCSVVMQFYDIDGAWTVNASVKDLSSAYDDDESETFSYGTLFAVRGNIDGISFGSVNLGSSYDASNDPLSLNNTGNQNFTTLNLTAYNLVGQGAQPDQFIDVSNIYVNATADNYGDTMVNETALTLTGGSLPRDIGGTDSNADIYFRIQVPGAGLSNQDYVSSSPWLLEVFPQS